MLDNNWLQHTLFLWVSMDTAFKACWSFTLAASLSIFSLLFPVMSDVLKSAKERKELSSENGVAKEEDAFTVRRNGFGVEGVRGFGFSLPQCVKIADSEPLALQSGGDVVIGGLFPLHYVAPMPQHSYQSKPQLTPCSR